MCKWNIVSVLVTTEIRFCYWHLNDCFYTFFIQLYISLFPLVSWQMWKREHTRASNLTFLFVTHYFCLIYVAMLLLHIYICTHTIHTYVQHTYIHIIHIQEVGEIYFKGCFTVDTSRTSGKKKSKYHTFVYFFCFKESIKSE